MNNPTLRPLSLGLILGAAVLAGCATRGPIGAVVPLPGGDYRSVVQSVNLADATKNFDHDAKLTCGSSGTLPGTSRPGRYMLVSQTAKTKEGKEIEASNKNVQAGIAAGMRYLGLESRDAVTLESVFKCQ